MEDDLDERSAEFSDKFEKYQFDVKGDQWNKEVRGKKDFSASSEYHGREQVQSATVSVSNGDTMEGSSREFTNGHASRTSDKNENGSATSLDQEESDFASSKTQPEELRQLCDVLMEERDKATASLRERSDEVLRLRKRAVESGHEKSDLKIRLAEVQSHAEQLEEDLTSVKEENERLKAEIDRLRNRINELEVESANLKDKFKAREDHCDVADGKITTIDSVSADLALQALDESVWVASEEEKDKKQQELDNSAIANKGTTVLEAQQIEEEVSSFAAPEETPPATESEIARDETACVASEEEEVKNKQEPEHPVNASEGTIGVEVERTVKEVISFAEPEETSAVTESEIARDESVCVVSEEEEEVRKQQEFEHPVIATEATTGPEALQTDVEVSAFVPSKETPLATESEVVVKRRETWRTAPNYYRHSFAGSLPRPFHSLELHSQHSLDHSSKHERSESVHSDASGESESDVQAPPSIPSFMRRRVEKPFVKSAGLSPVQFNYQPLPVSISNKRGSWLGETRARSDSLPTAHEYSSDSESSGVVTESPCEWVEREQVANTLNSALVEIDGVNGSDNANEFGRSIDFDAQTPQYAENIRDSSMDLAPSGHGNGSEVVQHNGEIELDKEEKEKREHVSDLVTLSNSRTELEVFEI